MSKPSIIFVTGNEGKLREVNMILAEGSADSAQLAFSSPLDDIDLPELQGSPDEIARDKISFAVKEVMGPCVIEDTSLCFNALGGLPGPYIKWFLKAIHHQGLNNLLAAYPDKSAYALCVFAFCAGPGQPVHVFEGRTEGKIVPARGPADAFGWDPVFEPIEGRGRTYAEMPKEEKNLISHRRRALEKLRKFLIDNPLH